MGNITPASEIHHYDPVGWGLKEFCTKSGEKTVGMISFCPALNGEQSSVALTVLVSNDFATSAFTFLKAAMGNPSFRFVIVANFWGLSVEHAPQNPIPKFAEFADPDLLKRRPYFSDAINMSVRTFT